MELKESPELVERFRDGDRGVLDALYRAHVDAVARMLRDGFTFSSDGRTVRFRGFTQPFRLQEAVQDGFIHAFRAQARQAYDGTRAYGPYLRTIVRNRLIDRFRRQQLEASLFVQPARVAHDDETEQEALDRLAQTPSATSPESQAWQNQLSEVLAGFIDELEPTEQAIVRRHMMGELTQQEMADALGVSRNDVRKHIRLIRQALLRRLKSAGVIASLDAAEAVEALNLSLILLSLEPFAHD